MSRDYVLQPFRPTIDPQIDYARDLNEQQHAAVTAPPGPALVIAGAGAGKTRTLIYRVAYLLEQGIPPDRILLLTFTNKAAKEMMRRVTDLLSHDLNDLWGGTFHSIGNRVLRKHADRIGFKPSFTILDREDARDLVKSCVADAEIDTKATRFPKADVLVNVFSKAVNVEKSVAEVIAEDYGFFANLTPAIEALSRDFVQRKRNANVMDFDDLLVLWLRLLRENSDLLEIYQRRFQFILVDEYQDTNIIQASVVDLLAARHGNVMVVGDDSQSIYSWRGANFANILEFPQRYPQANVYKIETNYRSTPEILTLANASIRGNTRQFEKALAPARSQGTKPAVVACAGTDEQSAFVAQRILELRDEGVNLDQIAVLYRSHFHALELQLELTRRNIPFSITSGIRFFEQAHIKDVAAYLKLMANPGDELSFKRIVQLLPGIGGKGADKVWKIFQSSLAEQGVQLGDDAQAESNLSMAAAFQKCASQVPKKAAKAWTELAITISQIEEPSVKQSPGRTIELILDAGYEDHLQETYTNYRSRLEDCEQLGVFAGNFSDTTEFLSQLSLLSNLEAEDNRPVSRDDEQIRLSTIHQAKGLEFDVVFVIMLCDGLFPSERSLEDRDGEEEERRLFYVAVTRARNELYLSYPLVRNMPGGGEFLQQPSRFLNEIPKELVDEWNLRSYHSF